MHTIDLNVDLGEGCDNDIPLLDHATSINVACGWHAGDAVTMRNLAAAAAQRGIAIGAHPGYPDRAHFGRRSLALPPDEIYAGVLYQVGALAAIVKALGAGVRFAHVKPHGALYNDAERRSEVAEAIVAAVRDLDPSLAMVGLAGGELIAAARRAGLSTANEAFADRGYLPDGTLIPRSEPDALISRVEEVTQRAVELVKHGRVRGRGGDWTPVRADTLCLHGDGPHALEFAARIGAAMRSAQVRIACRAVGPRGHGLQ